MILPKKIFVVAFKCNNVFERSESIVNRAPNSHGYFDNRVDVENAIDDHCRRAGSFGLAREKYLVQKFVLQDPSINLEHTQCPKCHRNSWVSSIHGTYCADVRCKNGWETPIEGDPSAVPIKASAVIDILNRAINQLLNGATHEGFNYAVGLIVGLKQTFEREFPPVSAKSNLPSLTSFQKLVLRALLFLVRQHSAVAVPLERVEDLAEDLRRVIKQ